MGKSATTGVLAVGAAPAARSWKVWAAAGLLVVAVTAAYGNSFHGPFIFDDNCAIAENPSIRHLWSWQVLTPPPETFTPLGRPALNISLAINYALGGLNVEGYHAVNLAIHILAALALLGLVRRTLLLPTLAARFGSASTGLALAVALLWAIHPLQTESVTYIVQRAEALVGLFYLLMFYCFVRGATSARGFDLAHPALSMVEGRGKVWYAAAVGACALGMASKEVMVSAPLVALLYDRVFISGSFKESLRRRWRWYLALAATWALLGLLVYQSLGRGGSAGFGLGMTAWEYARTQFGCIIHYLRLAFWPSPLVQDYGIGTVSEAADIVPYAIGVGLLLAATAVALGRHPKWGFLGVWFFAILAPTSSIVPLVGQTEAEHRMYLPLAAVVALVVLAAYAALEGPGRRSAKKDAAAPRGFSPLAGAVAVALVLAVAAALGWGTYQRNEVYQSALAISDDTVAKCPLNYRAYNNRGLAYDGKGQYDAAIKDYDKALSLKPDSARTYYNRGVAYRNKGQNDAAIKDYDKALSLKPDDADTYNNRGNAYYGKGQYDAGIKDFDKALSLKSDFEAAYYNRGNAFNRKGQYDAAIKDYDKALSLKPDDADAYNNRAVSHFLMKAYDRAWADVKMYRKLGGTPNPKFIEDLTRASGRSE